jgi:hypothetical protein
MHEDRWEEGTDLRWASKSSPWRSVRGKPSRIQCCKPKLNMSNAARGLGILGHHPRQAYLVVDDI